MTYTFDAATVSDLHKDARGFRPRDYFWDMWDRADDDLKQSIWDNLCKELDAEIAREKAEQDAAVAEFEQTIAFLLESGAVDRADAIRWYLEGLELSDSDLMYGGSYICFETGLPYDMAGIFDPICKEMLGDKSFQEVFG